MGNRGIPGEGAMQMIQNLEQLVRDKNIQIASLKNDLLKYKGFALRMTINAGLAYGAGMGVARWKAMLVGAGIGGVISSGVAVLVRHI